MGNRPPAEDELQEEGLALFKQLRDKKVPVKLSRQERDKLLRVMGATERNVDELLSLEEDLWLDIGGEG